MATKLFLRNTQTHGITGTGDGILYDMQTSAGAASDTCVTNTSASGTQIQATKTAGGSTVAWISGRAPAGGFTLTTTDISLWQQENNMNANVGGRYRVFKYSGGTITEIGGGPFDDGVEQQTTNTEDTWTGDVTDTVFAEDDRILIRYYLTNIGTMGGSFTSTMTFNAADAATGDSFFNIAQTVTFKLNDTSLALTGVSLTASPGTLAVAHDQAITGNAATAAVGTLAQSRTTPLTGNQITGAVGSVGQVRNNLFSASSFNVTVDQVLSAYEGQINAIWTKHPDSSYTGEFHVDAASDRLWQDNIVAYFAPNGVPANADYFVEGTFHFLSSVVMNVGIYGRMDSTLNQMYGLRFNSTIWELRKVMPGSPAVQTTLASSTNSLPSVGNPKRARLFMQGTSIWGELEDGTIIGPVTDTDITAAGRAGVRGSGSATSTTGYHLTGFQAGNLNTSQALAGVSLSGAVGTFAVGISAPLSNVVTTSSIGTFTPAIAPSLSGVAGTLSPGSLGVSRDKTLSGVESAAAVGTLAPSLTVTITGVQLAGSVGTVTASQAGSDVTVGLTGVSATASLGSLAVDRASAVSGVSGAASIGNLTPALSVTLSGQQTAAAVGLMAPAIDRSLTGVSASGLVNAPGVSVTVSVTGNQATGAIGTLAPNNAVIVALSGVQATGQLGTLSIDRTSGIAGVESVTALGSFGISKGGSAQLGGVSSVASVGNLSPEISAALSGNESSAAAGLLTASRVVNLSGVFAVVEAGSLSLSVSVGLQGVGAVGQVGSLGLALARLRTIQSNRGGGIVSTGAGQVIVTSGNTSATVKHER